MRHPLHPHAGTPTEAVARVWADILRTAPSTLTLDYVVTGDIEALEIPPTTAPARVDELWRTTCFELFLAAPAGEDYVELNFAPSGQWAAYAFKGYRRCMGEQHLTHWPRIEVIATSCRLAVLVSLDLAGVAGLPGGEDWRLGVSAVIEEAGGAKSYWALRHPDGKPDFHNPDNLAVLLERYAP